METHGLDQSISSNVLLCCGGHPGIRMGSTEITYLRTRRMNKLDKSLFMNSVNSLLPLQIPLQLAFRLDESERRDLCGDC